MQFQTMISSIQAVALGITGCQDSGGRRRKRRGQTPQAEQMELLEDRQLLAASPIDGTGNNLTHPDWGSTNEDLLRIAAAEYGDGKSSVGGVGRPGVRVISNTLSDQSGQDIISERSLSAMAYVWGQFIDHDLDLTNSGTTETLKIEIPKGDPWFDPGSTGTAAIYTSRSVYNPATGSTTANPRQQTNSITAFLDGSMIYGSDAVTAKALRTMTGGRLKTSTGNMLPVNNAATFPTGTLTMANANPAFSSDQLYAAGDVRANENIELTAMHTVFVREHNRLATQIAAANPGLNDEQIYQRARATVIGELQVITYKEWLPSILGPGAMDPYRGYQPGVNPGISNEFSTAGFRFGHSMLGDDVEFLNNQGLPTRDGVALSEAFFNPKLLADNGIDSVLKYLASDPSSEIDLKAVDSVRNFLFGPPGAGGLDLISLNITRGRDHGLADYNATRVAYGLPAVTKFSDITKNTEVSQKLQQLYGSVDNIDLWVGALAEDHVRGGSVGVTLRAIISDQFERLRDGDRFWYQNQFRGAELQTIERTTLAGVIQRNSALTGLQNNAFYFKAAVAGTIVTDRNGNGRPDPRDPAAARVKVQLVNVADNEVVATTTSDARGRYEFNVQDGLRTGVYRVRAVGADGTTIKESLPIRITAGDQFRNGVDLAIPSPNTSNPQPPRNQPPGNQPPRNQAPGNPARSMSGAGVGGVATVSTRSAAAGSANPNTAAGSTSTPGNRTGGRANPLPNDAGRPTVSDSETALLDHLFSELSDSPLM